MTGGIRVHLLGERGVMICIANDAVNGVWLEG